MHPTLLGRVAHDHVDTLLREAEAARLARSVRAGSPGLRHRAGLRLIALGERLAPECPQSAYPIRQGRA